MTDRLHGWRFRLYRRVFGLQHWRFQLADLLVLGRDIPDVPECYEATRSHLNCEQHAQSHTHEWRRCLIPSCREFAWRCRRCGARRCDINPCFQIRHHSNAHTDRNGFVLR